MLKQHLLKLYFVLNKDSSHFVIMNINFTFVIVDFCSTYLTYKNHTRNGDGLKEKRLNVLLSKGKACFATGWLTLIGTSGI